MDPPNELNVIYKQMIQDKIPEKATPTLMIMYGPPGSGKGFMTNHILTNNAPLSNISTINIDIDHVISQLASYKREIAICKEYFESLSDSKIDPKMIQLANQIYLKYRTAKDELSQCPEDITTRLITYALTNKLNIIHETTGHSIDWIIDPLIKNARSANYTIYVIYLVTKDSIIMDRLLSRAKFDGRFPNLEFVKESITKAQLNIKTLIPFVDFIDIYDNNSTPQKIKTLKGQLSSLI
ncbi:MAG: hypothetical protein Hyperionvirus31_16 [Hyperionvirus sp.]|uniref:Zeta toxin domain-containing protein n=1 Tax=Hyperionvirus sp. TaxID=2487770 RepID=A0A3G5ABN9_9VIRU|nr:MAG: hypothetical protein Hyperionvirus31_16 [Hyperionvirus sp.]